MQTTFLNNSQDPEKLAKRRTEKKERSAVLKEKIIKMIESGLQLSEYQARKAFTVYLQCILQVDTQIQIQIQIQISLK